MESLSFPTTKGSLFDPEVTNPLDELQRKIERKSPTRRSSRARELYQLQDLNDVTRKEDELIRRVSTLQKFIQTVPPSRENDEIFERELNSIKMEKEILSEALEEIAEEMDEEEDKTELMNILEEVEEESESEEEEEEGEVFPLVEREIVISPLDEQDVEPLGFEDLAIIDFSTVEEAIRKYPSKSIRYSFGDGQLHVDDSVILINKSHSISFYNPNDVINRIGNFVSTLFGKRNSIFKAFTSRFEEYPLRSSNPEKDARVIEKLIQSRAFVEEGGNIIEKCIDLDIAVRDFYLNNCRVCCRRIGYEGCCLSNKCVTEYLFNPMYNGVFDVEFTVLDKLVELYRISPIPKVPPPPENFEKQIQLPTVDIDAAVLWYIYSLTNLFGEMNFIGDGKYSFTKRDDTPTSGVEVFITVEKRDVLQIMTEGFVGGLTFYSDKNLSEANFTGDEGVTIEGVMASENVNATYIVENPDLVMIKFLHFE